MSLGEQSSRGDNSNPSPEQREDAGSGAIVGEYTWEDFFAEFDPDASKKAGHSRDRSSNNTVDEDWETTIDVHDLLGCPPASFATSIRDAFERGYKLDAVTYNTLDPYETPVTVGEYSWHHFVREFHDPSYAGVHLPEDFETEDYLSFPEDDLSSHLHAGNNAASALAEVVDKRTVAVQEELDEDAFFTSVDGAPTIVTRYDLEKAVPMEKKRHFREVERYWVNKPFAFITIFHSEKENETKYYLIEPYRTPIEDKLLEFLTGKLRTSIKYADNLVSDGSIDDRREVIERETLALLERYELYEKSGDTKGFFSSLTGILGKSSPEEHTSEAAIQGNSVRPEPVLIEEDGSTLNEFQVEKLRYYLQRDFIGYERIDGIKHDINVEDISCDGYNSPVFVYHTEYEQIISNVFHGLQRLDDFVIKLAQRSGKGISKRQPQVDATLPDGSRAQLTLGKEVSDHGTNYTIRQFNDVPFTPIDLINWRTFSLEEMAFLWLCIENHKSLIFAGGTASGKTTSLNAVSLFIPSSSKIVSIEDTREVELPQRNWIASVTRPSFSNDDKGDVDEFDLLEAALRQRPEYIVMGEIRGEEGRTLFQVMSTGHTTYTTFHADSVGEVLKRFTTAPINVSKTMFTALDLVSIQTSTRVHGKKVRRNKSLTEINHYDPENDEINVKDIYQWQAETDQYLQLGDSNTLDEILFDRGWDRARLEEELFKREVVIAYLIENGLKEYREVAATLQAFINDPETTFGLIANDVLGESLEDLREMESVLIDVDPEKEELVPRPDPDEVMLEETGAILQRAEEELFPDYIDDEPGHLADAFVDPEPSRDIEAEAGAGAGLFSDTDSDDLPDDANEGKPASDRVDDNTKNTPIPSDSVDADPFTSDRTLESEVDDTIESIDSGNTSQPPSREEKKTSYPTDQSLSNPPEVPTPPDDTEEDADTDDPFAALTNENERDRMDEVDDDSVEQEISSDAVLPWSNKEPSEGETEPNEHNED